MANAEHQQMYLPTSSKWQTFHLGIKHFINVHGKVLKDKVVTNLANKTLPIDELGGNKQQQQFSC